MEPTYEFEFDSPLGADGPLVGDPHAEIMAALAHLAAAIELLARRAVEVELMARRASVA